MTAKETARQDALRNLRQYIKPGQKVYTELLHRSASGMMRVVGCYIVSKGEICNISGMVARGLGWPFDGKRNGVRVSGCGMDIGYHVVYSLGYALFPKGWRCKGETCCSNEHSFGSNKPCDGRMRHKDGGYALRHSWL